jgi:acetylornithine/N-succinyldiaminopimelate aminotransferase
VTITTRDHLLQNYARASVTFVRGEGCELIDDEGKRYLDCIAGIAVCALGHAHPAIAEAVAKQASTLVHTSNLFYHEPSGTLAGELARRSGFDRVFFCNSGTETIEAAIKLARKRAYRLAKEPCHPEERAKRASRRTILACTGSFHGRTLGALAATDNPAYREGFDPLPDGFAFTPFNDVAALERNLDDRVAALFIEPVQGESGIHVATREFLEAARRLCDERGALLIFDEIQCGMGRTGKLFAFEHFGVRPNAITIAKALANGLPIGALICDEESAQALQPGDHGSTFGGSPIPAAAALAHFRVRDELSLDANVVARSRQFFDGLRALRQRHPDVYGESRGLGLLIGLSIVEPHEAKALVAAARERGVLFGTAGGNTLRIVPPLIIDDAQVSRALGALEEVGQRT